MTSSEQIVDGYGEVCDVLVPLREEGPDAYRLAQAIQLRPEQFRIIGTVPEGETLAFLPGEIVRCIIKILSSREAHWIAVGLASAESSAAARPGE